VCALHSIYLRILTESYIYCLFYTIYLRTVDNGKEIARSGIERTDSIGRVLELRRNCKIKAANIHGKGSLKISPNLREEIFFEENFFP
jgi:hypothetical protein